MNLWRSDKTKKRGCLWAPRGGKLWEGKYICGEINGRLGLL